MAHGLHSFVLRKRSAASAIRSHAGEQIRRNGDVAGFGNLVSKILNPVGHAKNFVDYKHDRRLALRLRIDDERFYRAAIVLEGDPFTMPRRFLQLGLGPVLRRSNLRGEQQKSQCEVFHGYPASEQERLKFSTQCEWNAQKSRKKRSAWQAETNVGHK